MKINSIIIVFFLSLTSCSLGVNNIFLKEKNIDRNLLHIYNIRLTKKHTQDLGGIDSKYRSGYLTKINKILENINIKYYGVADMTKILLVNTGRLISPYADPSHNIIISKGFIHYMKNNFTMSEVAALLCHESAHIINDDWYTRFKKENNQKYIDIKHRLDLRFQSIKKSDCSPKLSEKECRNSANASFSSHNYFLDKKDPYKLDTVEANNIISSSKLNDYVGFPLDVESDADKFSLNCLKKISINEESLMSLLTKMKNFNSINSGSIEQRIYNLKRKI